MAGATWVASTDKARERYGISLSNEEFALHIGAGESDEVFDLDRMQYRPDFVDPILEDLRAEGLPVTATDLRVQNWGYGADTLALGVILTGVAAFLLSGKRIEENLDAWIRLGGRFRRTN